MHPAFSDLLAKCRLPVLAALLVTVPAWMWLQFRYHDAPDFSAADILLTGLRTLNIWLTLIVIVGYAGKLLNFRPPWLNYANEAAFPIYILHQTVIVAIGYYVVRWDWDPYAKFAVILMASFAVSCLLYEWVIRRSAPLRRLFGVKLSSRAR